LPVIADVIEALAKFIVFSKMDAKSGFWQIALTKASYSVTAFTHPDGLSMWTRIAFGLKNGPPHF
jgi:hypothetical protein